MLRQLYKLICHQFLTSFNDLSYILAHLARGAACGLRDVVALILQ
jgi:hypothetical protein